MTIYLPTPVDFKTLPGTQAAPPCVVIVVEKDCCMQILATVKRQIYAHDPHFFPLFEY